MGACPSADSVIFTRDGPIKIRKQLARLGVSRLTPSSEHGPCDAQERSVHGQWEGDVRALGTLMVWMMEPGTSMQDPTSLRLRHPARWEDHTREFLARTSASAAELRRVECSGLQRKLLLTYQEPLLKYAKGTQIFRNLIMIKEKSIDKEWELCM